MVVNKLRTFIGSTMEDMTEERSYLVELINGNRVREPIYAEAFVARSESPKEVCLEEVTVLRY